MPIWFWKKSKDDTRAAKHSIPTVDVSGNEYHDLFPSKKRIVEILTEEEFLRSDRLNTIADLALKYRNQGGRGAAKQIIRSGRMLSAEELRDLGLRANRKIGRDFADAVCAKDVDYAIKNLESCLIFAFFEANTLHGLRRNQELGITHVIFSSAQDERNTDIENRYEGKRISIDEAKALLKNHGREITRSIFSADIPKEFLE